MSKITWTVIAGLLTATYLIPNSLNPASSEGWWYRQTHTYRFVDVTAKLEVDGEPITISRTIRCIRDWDTPFQRSIRTGR